MTAPRTTIPNSNMEIDQSMTTINDEFPVSDNSKTPTKDDMGSHNPPKQSPKSPPPETLTAQNTDNISLSLPDTLGYNMGDILTNSRPRHKHWGSNNEESTKDGGILPTELTNNRTPRKKTPGTDN